MHELASDLARVGGQALVARTLGAQRPVLHPEVQQVPVRLEEREPPIEIDAFLSSDPRKRKLLFTLDDPLEKLGGSYMNLANAYLQTRAEFPVRVRLHHEARRARDHHPVTHQPNSVMPMRL